MSGGLHSLATIIKRLEAATSRLEDLTVAQGNALAKRDDISDTTRNSGYGAPSPPAPVPPPAPPAPAGAPIPMVVEVPPSVIAYDETVLEKVKVFVDLTNNLPSPVVKEQVQIVEKAYNSLRVVLLTASACKKPDQDAFVKLLAPLQENVASIMRVVESNRKERQWYNHLQFIAEGAPSVGWVQIEPKPGPHVKQVKESAEFYGNKIIKEFKEKDQKQVDWTRAYLAILEEQRKYVMDHHTTGLSWNAKGAAVNEYSGSSKPATSAAVAPPPPPPPPPPPAAASPASGGGNGIGAVFAALNQGENVTKGLRKVDKSEMTHKNPELRAGSVVPAASNTASPKRPVRPSKPAALQSKKPPKFALEGNKWVIEYQENEPSLALKDVSISQIVNLYGCKNTTIQIKGKVNAVNLVNCTKTSVLMESVISSVSLTNSPSFALQITGSAPTIQIDSTDSGQIYLSKECLGVEILTAKCSSINVSLPVEGEEDGIFVERAVPEMLRTTVNGGKLVTSIVEHSA